MNRPRGAARSSTGAATRLQIVAQPAPDTPLHADFASGEGALAPYYFGHFRDAGAYVRKAAEVTNRFNAARREAIAAALRPVSGAARTQLARVIADEGYVVTTGQQAGLFGGPLYTLYKALTAIRLAATLEARLGRPVLPVFWIASEDHDWAEVSRTWVVNGEDRLLRLAIERETHAAEVSMARQPLGAGITAAIARLEAALPPGGGRERVAAAVRTAYAPDTTVADAFRALLADLLADFPICTLSAHDPVLKRLSLPLLRTELERSEAHSAAVLAQTERLRAAGYEAQVAVEPDATNLHYEGQAGRERLLRARDGFRLRRTRQRLSREQLLARLEADPARVSPGALLRPVVESALLPTLAYIGGPAEIAYFAQVGCLFRRHGVAPPIVYPRASFLLIEPRTARLLEKLGMSVADVDADAGTLSRRRGEAQLPAAAGTALLELQLATAEAWSRLRAVAAAIDATLEVPLRRLERESRKRVAEAERRMRTHQGRRDGVEARQIARICAQLRPDGVAQERLLNALPFVAGHDFELIRRIADSIEPLLVEGDRWAGPGCPS